MKAEQPFTPEQQAVLRKYWAEMRKTMPDDGDGLPESADEIVRQLRDAERRIRNREWVIIILSLAVIVAAAI